MKLNGEKLVLNNKKMYIKLKMVHAYQYIYSGLKKTL